MDELRVVAKTGSIPHGKHGSLLYGICYMMDIMLHADTQLAESINSLIRMIGKRSPRINLSTMSSRICLKKALATYNPDCDNKAKLRRWSDIKPLATRMMDDLVLMRDAGRALDAIADRWTEPPLLDFKVLATEMQSPAALLIASSSSSSSSSKDVTMSSAIMADTVAEAEAAADPAPIVTTTGDGGEPGEPNAEEGDATDQEIWTCSYVAAWNRLAKKHSEAPFLGLSVSKKSAGGACCKEEMFLRGATVGSVGYFMLLDKKDERFILQTKSWAWTTRGPLRKVPVVQWTSTHDVLGPLRQQLDGSSLDSPSDTLVLRCIALEYDAAGSVEVTDLDGDSVSAVSFKPADKVDTELAEQVEVTSVKHKQYYYRKPNGQKKKHKPAEPDADGDEGPEGPEGPEGYDDIRELRLARSGHNIDDSDLILAWKNSLMPLLGILMQML
jgi:hypothetical protein